MLPKKATLLKVKEVLEGWMEEGYVKHWMILRDVVERIDEDLREREVNEIE